MIQLAQGGIDRHHDEGQGDEALRGDDAGKSKSKMEVYGVKKRGQVAPAANGCGKREAAHHGRHGQGQINEQADNAAASAELLDPKGKTGPQHHRQQH